MGRVAVTGGSGKLGGACVAELVEHGWDVVNLDRVAPKRSPTMFVPVDLTDFGQVVEVLSTVDDRYVGIDAVVHLASSDRVGRPAPRTRWAWPAASRQTGSGGPGMRPMRTSEGPKIPHFR